MGPRFRIDGAACLLFALALLILPLNWLLAAFFAAMFHELCHYLAAKVLNISVLGFTVGSSGCLMSTGPMSKRQEIICAAAGPVGSILLLLMIRWFPRLALCAGVQGFYNLLPIYPMDGGRILACLAGERICILAAGAVCVILLLIGIFSFVYLEMGVVPFIFCMILAGKGIKMKKTLQIGESQSTIDLPKTKR